MLLCLVINNEHIIIKVICVCILLWDNVIKYNFIMQSINVCNFCVMWVKFGVTVWNLSIPGVNPLGPGVNPLGPGVNPLGRLWGLWGGSEGVLEGSTRNSGRRASGAPPQRPPDVPTNLIFLKSLILVLHNGIPAQICHCFRFPRPFRAFVEKKSKRKPGVAATSQSGGGQKWGGVGESVVDIKNDPSGTSGMIVKKGV
jgi:hypothetical protein